MLKIIKKFLHRKNKSSGAILIEFALAVPLLIVILYFALDAPKFSLIKTKVKNATYFTCSMIQNISQNREEKKITSKDLAYIVTSSFMNKFDGLRQFNFKDGSNDHCFGLAYIHYIKGESGGKASVVWTWNANTLLNVPSRAGPDIYKIDHGKCSVRYKTNVNPSEIHKDLIINEGEVKIAVDMMIHSKADKKIGFYLLTPKPLSTDTIDRCTFFNTVTIFTPKQGLFSETPPS